MEYDADYEARAAAALVLLENAARCGGVPDASIKIKHDCKERPYVLLCAAGSSHRIELLTGDHYLRITRVMHNILEVI